MALNSSILYTVSEQTAHGGAFNEELGLVTTGLIEFDGNIFDVLSCVAFGKEGFKQASVTLARLCRRGGGGGGGRGGGVNETLSVVLVLVL